MALADLTLDDIPLERVADLVQVLLGVPDVDDVLDVRIGCDAVTATVYAKDSSGHRYFGVDEQPATHLISRRVTS